LIDFLKEEDFLVLLPVDGLEGGGIKEGLHDAGEFKEEGDEDVENEDGDDLEQMECC
jgi:hypothetical protein